MFGKYRRKIAQVIKKNLQVKASRGYEMQKKDKN